MPFAPDARGDTFKESILAFYSPRRITPVNPWYRVKIFSWVLFYQVSLCAKSLNRKREVHF